MIFLEKKVNSLQMAGKYLNESALGGLSNMSPPRLASSFPSYPMHSDWHQVSQRQENVLLEKLESRLQDRVSTCDTYQLCVVTVDVRSVFIVCVVILASYCVWSCVMCCLADLESDLCVDLFSPSLSHSFELF